jgi:membrane protease YdiL (CAAX protease family)
MIARGTLRPMSIGKAIILFAATSALVYSAVYVAIPKLLDEGFTFLQAYLICFYFPFVVIFMTAILAFILEKGTFSWNILFERFRLQKIDKKTWIWIVGLTIFSLIAYLSLAFTGKLLARVPFLAPPAFFPAEINPGKTMVPGIFMDTPLKGQWWVILAYGAGWFFNIFGEELLWRGYLLPRQEILYGKNAWLVHGSLWTLWHVFWKWNLIVILPVALSIPFVVQRTRNTWVGIIAHGVGNFIPLVVIIIGVIR